MTDEQEFYKNRIAELEHYIEKQNKVWFRIAGRPVKRNDITDFIRGMMLPVFIILSYMVGMWTAEVQYAELKEYCAACTNMYFEDETRTIILNHTETFDIDTLGELNLTPIVAGPIQS